MTLGIVREEHQGVYSTACEDGRKPLMFYPGYAVNALIDGLWARLIEAVPAQLRQKGGYSTALTKSK